MTLSGRSFCMRLPRIAILLGIFAFIASSPKHVQDVAVAQTQTSVVEPSQTTKARLQVIVKGILAAWDKADVVCLGEDHGSKNDSDLRITLVEHPDFVQKVSVIMIEFANVAHQDTLDRFILECEDMPREKLRSTWSDANGAEVWESPIYEAFMRAIRKVNLALPRNKRLRLIAGDNPREKNLGKYIRDSVSREILDKGLKGLTIYGAGHCECRAMGFPGELESRYPGRIWAAFSFFEQQGTAEGRRIFALGDEPRLIPITGTDKAKMPAAKMFLLWNYNDRATVGDLTNAIVYFGNIRDTKVYPDKR
jgi:uncharacterized iron-regulated protein